MTFAYFGNVEQDLQSHFISGLSGNHKNHGECIIVEVARDKFLDVGIQGCW